MDLAAIDLESFPHNKCIAGWIGTGLPEIHVHQNEAELFVHGRNPVGNAGMLDDILGLDVFATCSRTTPVCPPGCRSGPCQRAKCAAPLR